MSKIFLLPGLGADCRIYRNIRLDNFEVIKADWIEPHEADTLAAYAQKLISYYKIGPGAIVIGTSMGGIVAVEIATLIKLEKIIVISTIKAIDESPPQFIFYRAFPVYNLGSNKSAIKLSFFIKRIFGNWDSKSSESFNGALEQNSPLFSQWIMKAVLNWKNKSIPPNTFHLAGTNDKIFPYKNLKNVMLVKGGSHTMIIDKAEEINTLLKMILNNEIASIVLPS